MASQLAHALQISCAQMFIEQEFVSSAATDETESPPPSNNFARTLEVAANTLGIGVTEASWASVQGASDGNHELGQGWRPTWRCLLQPHTLQGAQRL